MGRHLPSYALLLALAFVSVTPMTVGAAPARTGDDVPDWTAPQASYLGLAWEAEERPGGPVVHGWITNDGGMPAGRILLRVDSLDAGGRVTAKSSGLVASIITPGSRQPFEVAAAARAASYRVTVYSFDWVQLDHGDPRR